MNPKENKQLKTTMHLYIFIFLYYILETNQIFILHSDKLHGRTNAKLKQKQYQITEKQC